MGVICKKCGTEYKVSCHVCYPDTPTKNEKRISLLEKTFAHYYVNNGIDNSCKKCGLDLEDNIHIQHNQLLDSDGKKQPQVS